MVSEHSTTARYNRLGVNFAEGGKPEYQEENPQSQIEIDKSQPSCEEARETIPDCRGWRGKYFENEHLFLITDTVLRKKTIDISSDSSFSDNENTSESEDFYLWTQEGPCA